jgi:hypothetical protein
MEIPKIPKIILLFTGLICYTQAVFGQQVIKSPHGKLTIDIDCSACHRPNSWKPAKAKMNFNHKKMTGFALIGKHKMISCQSCHLDLRFDKPQVMAGNCGSCHVDVHQGKFGTNCISCHNQTSFHSVKGLAIHAKTGFPLTGAHQQLACQSCHQNDRNGAFTNLDTDCYSCHKKDYETAQSIDHVKQGFSTQCQQCHNTMGWGGAAFDHVTVSGGFALVGAHKQIRCESCHLVPSFANKFHTTSDKDCYSCHQSNFQDAHGGSNFPHTCLNCHNENSWGGAEFDHAKISNGFELLGSHKKLECSSCHIIPSYQNKFQATSDQDCYSCHQTDFQKAHGSGSGISTNCKDCHNENTWSDAEFTAHDQQYFPIYSGAHKGTWENCQTCHTTNGNYASFSCLNCHAHAKTTMDQKHSEVSGYSYVSTACYSCHPNGHAGD